MSTFGVPAGLHCKEIEVKKSRFICYIDYAESRDDLKRLVAYARERHPDARHHCWAFSCFEGREEGMNDDGEPKGTAGRPMLTVLQFDSVSNVAAVVVRYFGGIKLGTGGLARAYGDSVKAALETLETREYFKYWQISGVFEFSAERQLRYLATMYEAKLTVQYTNFLEVSFDVLENRFDELYNAIKSGFPMIKLTTNK